MPRVFSEGDREAIRRSLIDAGKALFLRYGIRKTSVEQLTHAVGIAKGTFYNFFDSKEDLCLAIFDQEEDVLGRDIAEIPSRSEDATQAMKELTRAMWAVCP